MEGQPSIDKLLNKITFLRKALEYYAENTTYACHNGVAPIDVDRGHQAKFALEQSVDIDNYNKELMKNYQENIEKFKEMFDDEIDKETLDSSVTIEELIEKYKNFK